jgi:hypothetical protein
MISPQVGWGIEYCLSCRDSLLSGRVRQESFQVLHLNCRLPDQEQCRRDMLSVNNVSFGIPDKAAIRLSWLPLLTNKVVGSGVVKEGRQPGGRLWLKWNW